MRRWAQYCFLSNNFSTNAGKVIKSGRKRERKEKPSAGWLTGRRNRVSKNANNNNINKNLTEEENEAGWLAGCWQTAKAVAAQQNMNRFLSMLPAFMGL